MDGLVDHWLNTRQFGIGKEEFEEKYSQLVSGQQQLEHRFGERSISEKLSSAKAEEFGKILEQAQGESKVSLFKAENVGPLLEGLGLLDPAVHPIGYAYDDYDLSAFPVCYCKSFYCLSN